MMIREPASRAPINRSPTSTVRLKTRRKYRLRRLTITPFAAANSGEKRVSTNCSLRRQIETIIREIAMTP